MKINQRQHVTRKGVLKRNPLKKNSSNKLQTFSGHYVGKLDGEVQTLSFNLYNNPDLNYDKTKANIMYNMNTNHLRPMYNLFSKAGLLFKKFEWFSPSSYNYTGDNVDIVLSVADREKLKRFIKHHSVEIQKMLDSNQSYDGYMATTANSVEEIIQNIDKDFDVDIMVVSFIQSKYVMDMYDDLYNLYDEDENDN